MFAFFGVASVFTYLRAAAYLLGLFVIYHSLLGLNADTDPDVPWFVAPYSLIVLALTAWPASRWSAWPIFTLAGIRTQWLLVVLGVTLSIAAFILCGAVFGIIATSWPVPDSVSPAFRYVIQICYPLLSAVTEEIGFRGILQGGLERAGGGIRALLVASIVFVLAHGNNSSFLRLILFYATLAIVCGIVARRAQSVAPAIILHGVVNGILLAATMTRGPIELNNLPSPIFWVIAIAAIGSLYTFIAVVARQSSRRSE
jgi:membrane protease YdiL (CAAX protease family)